jgi:succinate dehydrogenase / fumarate reductase, cytochrome b subunit
MKRFLSASIGKKVLVSLSGLFLISFLAVHLAVNLFLLGGPETYNRVAHFMATDVVISFLEPMLAVGFLLHIIYSVYLTVINRQARPENYKLVDQSQSSAWASRNMFVLGGLILIFLVQHLSNFWYSLQFGHVDLVTYGDLHVPDAYSLVTGKFIIWWYVLIYVAGSVFLGFHLLHGFDSAFLTLGLYNKVWRKRLAVVGTIYSLIIAAGFAIIPVYFLLDHIFG